MLVLPFILLAAPAGYCADRFSKRSVIVACKAAEVILMILSAVVILHGNVWLMFFTLFLMGSHSAIFGPSKYGSIPEIVRPERISAANGLIGMTTIMAIVFGTVAPDICTFGPPFRPNQLVAWAATIICVAATGLITSLPIRRLPRANPSRKFPVNFAGETYRDLRTLMATRSLFLEGCASTLFWSLGGLCLININHYGDGHCIWQKTVSVCCWGFWPWAWERAMFWRASYRGGGSCSHWCPWERRPGLLPHPPVFCARLQRLPSLFRLFRRCSVSICFGPIGRNVRCALAGVSATQQPRKIARVHIRRR